MFSISGIVHLRSNALERTILKICGQSASAWEVKAKPHTFWTLMLWLVLLKMRLAFIARAKRLACDESVGGSC